MTRFLGGLLAITLAACVAGEAGTDPNPGPADMGNPDKKDPPLEENEPNPNEVVCAGAFTLAGTFTPGTPAQPPPNDPEYDSCWPFGLWTFKATVDNTAEVLDITGDGVGDRCGEVQGTTPASVSTSYSFRVNREADIDDGGTPNDTSDDAQIGWKNVYTIVSGAAQADLINIKVSGDGGGDCTGLFEFLGGEDKAVWNFRPTLTGTALGGIGDYTLYVGSQR
jgi:hypothetical protein